MITADQVMGALDAIERDGGDPMQPTAIRDQNGATVAVVQRLASGEVAVDVPSGGGSANVVQTVTGFLDRVAGTITNIATQLQRTGNAVRGGAAGAQVGYNTPLNLTPWLLGGAAVLLTVAVLSGRRR